MQVIILSCYHVIKFSEVLCRKGWLIKANTWCGSYLNPDGQVSLSDWENILGSTKGKCKQLEYDIKKHQQSSQLCPPKHLCMVLNWSQAQIYSQEVSISVFANQCSKAAAKKSKLGACPIHYVNVQLEGCFLPLQFIASAMYKTVIPTEQLR